MKTHPSGAAVLDIDIFSDEALEHSSATHKVLRDAGDAVWISQLDMIVITRFAEVAKAVMAHANGEEFDAMEALSSHLPLNVISDLVGLKGVDGNQMLDWSMGIFDAFGPMESTRPSTSPATPPITSAGAWAHVTQHCR